MFEANKIILKDEIIIIKFVYFLKSFSPKSIFNFKLVNQFTGHEKVIFLSTFPKMHLIV